MRIAVAYDNGSIFQHFGKTETFKFYEVSHDSVSSTSLVPTNCGGHSALAAFLQDAGVNVVICGNMGDDARAALEAAGITIFSGAQGNADEAVAACLAGRLVSVDATCDHHHEEEHECCCGGEEEGCGGSCGSCGGCGGCGGHSNITGKNVGKTVRAHYRGTLNDGSQFDSSYDRGEPLEFVCGAGQMIEGFDAAVANMDVGEILNVHLMPEEAYGPVNPNAIFTLEIAKLPGAEDVEVGQQVYLADQYGRPFMVKVTAKDDVFITFDANHEMAGKELNFQIELVEIL